MPIGIGRRFILLALVAWLLFFWTSPSAAGPPIRIAVLISHDAPAFGETLAGFKAYLSEQGVAADYKIYPLQGGVGQVPRLSENSGQPEPQMILALGSLALDTAHQIAENAPILAGMVLREEDIRKVPGATGVYLEFPLETQFSWIRRILPQARRVGVLYNPEENRDRIQEATGVAGRMGLELIPRQVSGPQDIPGALESLENWADVLWGISDHIVVTPETAKNLLLFSFRNRIPFIGLSQAWAKAGAFYALDRDYQDIGRQCGELATQVLEGRSPSSVPPVAPRKVVFFLNQKTADQIKIEIPAELRQKAKQVY